MQELDRTKETYTPAGLGVMATKEGGYVVIPGMEERLSKVLRQIAEFGDPIIDQDVTEA